MTTLRLFGQDIKVEEKKKNSITLFGTRIFSHAALEKNKRQQHYNRHIDRTSSLPPHMCEAIRLVKGTEPVYIGRKDTENSDVNVNLSRFLFPATHCTELLDDLVVSGRETGLDVSVMDPQGNFHDMKFNRWRSLEKFVLNRGWNKLVADNGLQKGDTIDLWHFKTPEKPCFAINITKH
ncbi:unnamed protein product [Withania somnifera]